MSEFANTVPKTYRCRSCKMDLERYSGSNRSMFAKNDAVSALEETPGRYVEHHIQSLRCDRTVEIAFLKMVSPSEKLCARAVTRTWSHLAIIPSRFFASRCCIMSLVGHTTRLRWSGGTCVSVPLAECCLLAPDWPKRHRFRLQRKDFQPFLLL